jgi:hypothetical protein
MKFFSFKAKKRPPMSRVIPYDVEIVTRRTCQAYTWSWRVANGKGLNPQQGARVDALVRQYCTAQAHAASLGTRTQVISLLLP